MTWSLFGHKFIFKPILGVTAIRAAVASRSISIIYYGSHKGGAERSIINAHPEFLVSNSPAGPWKGDADINAYMSAGIKYFEYLDGGYEGTVSCAIQNDLQSNLNYITAVANAGAYGIFLDEVTNYPDAASLYNLEQIYNKAHSLGLKVVFNVGVSSWSSQLMSYCDYLNSSETWQNDAPTISQIDYGNRVWLETQGVTNASTAAILTLGAWDCGMLAEYACSEYTSLPSWLRDYISQISPSGSRSTVSHRSRLIINSSVLPNGTVGTAYSQTMAATGGVAPYIWKIVSGKLPAGLSLSSDGVVSGTPIISGRTAFVTFQLTDSTNAVANLVSSITIGELPDTGPATTTSTTPSTSNTTTAPSLNNNWTSGNIHER